MAFGKTLELIKLTRQFGYRTIAPHEKRDRDRTLAGKKRIRARREARRS